MSGPKSPFQMANEMPKNAAKESLDVASEERVLDLPVEVTINDKTFQYTGRPMGYIQLVIRELMHVGQIFEKAIEAGRGENVDWGLLIEEHGVAGTKVMCRIAQLMVQPVDGKPAPPADACDVSLEEIEWGLSGADFGILMSAFIRRDVVGGVGKVMGLVQRP